MNQTDTDRVVSEITFTALSSMVDHSLNSDEKRFSMSFVLPQISLTASLMDSSESQYPLCQHSRLLPSELPMRKKFDNARLYWPRKRCIYFDMSMDEFEGLLRATHDPPQLQLIHKQLSTQCQRFIGRKSWSKTHGDQRLYLLHSHNLELCQRRRELAHQYWLRQIVTGLTQ